MTRYRRQRLQDRRNSRQLADDFVRLKYPEIMQSNCGLALAARARFRQAKFKEERLLRRLLKQRRGKIVLQIDSLFGV